MNALGIDIGGSSVKGAVVDTANGRLLTPVQRIANGRQVSPGGLVESVRCMVRDLQWDGSIGVGFPGLLRGGTVRAALNLHPDFGGVDFQDLLRQSVGPEAWLLNDADAVGLAEAALRTRAEAAGSVLVLTFGTGIGSAFIVNGRLCPNTEFGLLPWRGKPAQDSISAAAKVRRKTSYRVWAQQVDAYLGTLDTMINPDLIIVGGAISAEHERWLKFLTVATPVVPAGHLNDAGIIGAALYSTPPYRR